MQYKPMYCYNLFSFVVLPLTLHLHSFPHMTVHKQSVLIYAVHNNVLLQTFFSFCTAFDFDLHSFPHMTVHKQRVLIYAVQNNVLLQPAFSFSLSALVVKHLFFSSNKKDGLMPRHILVLPIINRTQSLYNG
jgi:hypothetical protein